MNVPEPGERITGDLFSEVARLTKRMDAVEEFLAIEYPGTTFDESDDEAPGDMFNAEPLVLSVDEDDDLVVFDGVIEVQMTLGTAQQLVKLLGRHCRVKVTGVTDV